MENTKKYISKLLEPVDIASIVFFRFSFSICILWEAWHFFKDNRIKFYYVDPSFLFSYYGFSWVKPWSEDILYFHFLLMAVLAIFIGIGFLYRISCILLFLSLTYIFLLDATTYLNHFYLIILVSFLMIFVPSNKSLSVDSYRNPDIKSDFIPSVYLWILRFQIGIAYFYGGIAKLNTDWLNGQPMRVFLYAESDNFPLIGRYFKEDFTVYLFNYGALLMDLLIVPFLLWRKTRPFAFVVAVLFNVMNSLFYEIGIFSWFMILATTLFFSPSWPRLGGELWPFRTSTVSTNARDLFRSKKNIALLAFFSVYALIQILVPFRHLLYPGNVSWTEEGHNFSWHMKLRSKKIAGKFIVNDKTSGKSRVVDLRKHLNVRQIKRMFPRPDLVLQFSHYLAEDLKKKGYEDIEIKAIVIASLNYREPQYLIDTDVNLANVERNLAHSDWIIPLKDGEVPKSYQEAQENLKKINKYIMYGDDKAKLDDF